MVQRQLLRQVRAIYFNMSSYLPYEVLLLLLLTEVFEDIVLCAFLATFITSTNVSRRLQGEVSQSIFAKNYIAAVLRKTLETYTELDQVAFVVQPAKVKQNLEEILGQFSLTSDRWGDLEVTSSVVFFFSAAIPEEVIDESPDITAIILILLAVIILALLIVFFIIFYHRRRRNKTKGTFGFLFVVFCFSF